MNVDVDVDSGTYTVTLTDGWPLLLNASSAVVCADGAELASDRERTLSRSDVEDEIGAGSRWALESRGPGHATTTLLTSYPDVPGITVETVVRNTGETALGIAYIEACRTLPANGAALYPPDPDGRHTAQFARLLSNGYLHADPGRIEVIDSTRVLHSCWNLAIRNQDNDHTIAVGAARHDAAELELEVRFDMRAQPRPRSGGLELHARSRFGPAVEVAPGATLSSGPLLLTWAPTPHEALEAYARTCGLLHGAERKPPLMGWCSWYYTLTETSEEEVLRNARFVAEHLKDYGLDVIQVDDGFQRGFGDWEGNDRFPRGMGGLAEEIRKLGLRPGIWLAPYVLDRDGKIAREHPEWVGRDIAGAPKRAEDREGRGGVALDPTHPEALEWLRQLFRTVAHDWGYEMIKLDFVEWSVLAIERYHDPSVGRAGAYRRGLEAIREEVGEDRHILDCGPVTAAGLCDSWRTEFDFDELTWRQYTQEPYSNVHGIANRYYFHGHLWANDPDHLGLTLLTESQGRAVASLMALSGGTLISGDPLYALSEAKLEILRKVLPAWGRGARPVDLFENGTPAVFHLPVDRPFGSWHVVGLFNWTLDSWTRKTVELARLGIDGAHAHVAHEFWTQRPVEVRQGAISVDLPPASCAVLAIRSAQDQPQVLGTDRHVLQGAVELAHLEWDAASRRLTGELNAVAGSRPTLTFRVPRGLTPVQATIDGTSAPVGGLVDGLLRLCVPAAVTGPQQWTVGFA